MNNNKKIIRNLAIYLGVPILIFFVLLFVFTQNRTTQAELKYSDVLEYFEEGQVTSYKLDLGTGAMELKLTDDKGK